MEEADEAMIPHSATGRPHGPPIAVYPPLPPFMDHDLRLTEETTTRTAVIHGGETSRQVEALAQHSAVVQQRTAEQLGQVQEQQDRLAAQTSEYLQAQHDRQSALLEQQEEMKRQMDEHRKFLEEQYRLLRAAEEAVGLQGRRLESLAEAVQPHIQARWGAFAQGAAPPTDSCLPQAPAVTVATGTNLPVPPIYRGSSKKEKRDFMDSYAIYSRRMKALNQGTQAKVFVMPLSSCIEQGTMVRICGFELFKEEKDVTETEWRDYFLSARMPDNTAYKTLDREVKNLCMDTELQDAESRLSRLMADFYEIVDRLNMEDVIQVEPKKVVGYLVEALRPLAFKAAVKDQLGRQSHKSTKSNIHTFLKWVRGEMEDFMRFEAHITSSMHGKAGAKGDQAAGSGGASKTGAQIGSGKSTAKDSQRGAKVTNPKKGKTDIAAKTKSQDKKCFKCGDPAHGVFQCPEVAGPAEAKDLYERTTGRKVLKPVLAVAPANASGALRPIAGPADAGSTSIPCIVMDVVETSITPDSAAEVSVVTSKLLTEISKQGAWITHRNLEDKAAVIGVGDQPVPVKSKVKLDLRFVTPGGPLILRDVICWVSEQPLPTGVGDLLLSRWIMERLGYSAEKLLAAAQQISSEWDMSDVGDGGDSGVPSVLAYTGIEGAPEPTQEERALHDDEARACFPTLEEDVDTEREQIRRILLEKVDEAQRLGASPTFVAELQTVLMELIDVFRLVIGRDPPVDMPPMEVTLKPGAVPVRCRARRYSPTHRAFLKKHIDALITAGLCYRNPKSRWCSPPHVVNKPEAGDHRMTVDVRAANDCVEQIVWPMPMLEVIFDQLRGSSRYFSLDFFKGFWQFAMALICQEIYSILTEEGVITPTRVLMGGTNSVAYVQSTVQEMFAELFNNGLLIWIDDLLGYESSDEGLLTLLRKVLTICAEKGLKLNPKKCSFYLREALWCGRVVSGDGVRHDPARVDALTSLPAPTTGQELQQFVCAMNWMRTSLPAYNKLIDPLVRMLEKVYERAGGRKKTQVRSVRLSDVGWGADEATCLDLCKAALRNAVQLAHPDPAKRLCVYTDASDEHWGAVITQIPPEHSIRPLSEQEHQPLMMLSGSFSGSAKRWAIVEKEAYAIIETCRRADYLLHRPDGFALFTDHRNLRYIFDPHSVSTAVPKYTADKLHRWSLLLMAYKYEIYDISGDDNVWADLLSRWGSSFKTVCAIRQVPLPLSPQLDGTFVWPTWKEIRDAQSAAAPPSNVTQSDNDSLWKDEKGRIWIPDEATTLQVRVCVVGHFGIAGHRGLTVTREKITGQFVWTNMDSDIAFFVQRCLHCASTLGGPPQPRVLGEAMHAERPNELIHWDYLYLGESATNQEYVLVIKDDASKFAWLLPCEAADAETTYNALIDWFASFGVCRTWVSDQGTHFKNSVIEALQHALGAHHHFTTARCPWANGTVEVVMRETLRCCRALLSEWRMQPREWTRVIKIVQMALNNTPSPSLGGVAPITAMTGLPAMGPSDHIAVPGPIALTTLDQINATQREHVVRLQRALENMHKRTSAVNAATRAIGRKAHDKKRNTTMAQFDIGDYVLYADVWQHTRSKLRVKWCGPAQVTATISNWIFEIQNLITGQRKEAHASRLKFYADESLEVNEELLMHVAHNSEGHVVDTLLKARYNPSAKRHEIKVHWRGLDTVEDSWEPADVLLQDVPTAVKAFVRKHNKQQPVKALRKALHLN